MPHYPWLLLAVYVVTVGGVQLLALWAATSTKPWLLRALVVWGAIVLLLPIRVMEPAAMLTMSAAWTMGISAAIARLSSPREESGRMRRLLRFGLADVLVLMLFLGTWLALVNRWLPRENQLWYTANVAVAILPLAILSILAHRTVVGPRRVWMGLLTIAAIWTCALLLRSQNAPLNLGENQQTVGWWYPHDNADVAAQLGALPLVFAACVAVAFIAGRALRTTPAATSRRRRLTIVSVALAIAIPAAWLIYDEFASRPKHFLTRMLEIGNHCILLALAGFIVLVTWLATASWNKSPGWSRHVARAASLGLVVVIVLPAVGIYWQLLWYAPFPQLNDRGLGHYERIREITMHYSEYAKSRLPPPPTLRGELDEAVVLLRDWNDVPRQLVETGLTSRTVVAKHGLEMTDILALTRAFEEAAAQQPDADRAAEYAMASIRFGAMVDHTGWTNYGSQGYYFLGQHRDDVSIVKAREIAAQLQQTLDERFPLETVEAWHRAGWERHGGWHQKLKQILAPYSRAIRVTPDRNSKGILDYRKSWETINRLIQAHLAIRIYKSENGRLPTSLEDLTPGILTELPLDPFSGRVLIYRPSDPTYELYSVGPDGMDDGGKVRYWSIQPAAKGFDLGLP